MHTEKIIYHTFESKYKPAFQNGLLIKIYGKRIIEYGTHERPNPKEELCFLDALNEQLNKLEAEQNIKEYAVYDKQGNYYIVTDSYKDNDIEFRKFDLSDPIGEKENEEPETLETASNIKKYKEEKQIDLFDLL